MEIWKDIPGMLGYQVSNLGNVHSFWTKCTGYHAKNKPYISNTPQRQLDIFITNSGYRAVRIKTKIPGKSITVYIHRMVLEAFIGPCPDGMEACHNDGNKLNNNPENLRWDTRKKNMEDAKKHGKMKWTDGRINGERHYLASITDNDAKEIKKLFSRGVRQSEIAKKIGINKSLVWKIVHGYAWKHI